MSLIEITAVGTFGFLAIVLVALEAGAFGARRKAVVYGSFAVSISVIVGMFVYVETESYEMSASIVKRLKEGVPKHILLRLPNIHRENKGGVAPALEAFRGKGKFAIGLAITDDMRNGRFKLSIIMPPGPSSKGGKGKADPDISYADKLRRANKLPIVWQTHPPIQDCAICPPMAIMLAGKSQVGSPIDEPGRKRHEGPVRPLQVIKPFAMSVYEVTRGQYDKFILETGYAPKGACSTGGWFGGRKFSYLHPGFRQDEDHPAVCLGWHDAKAYVAWLSRKTGRTYRLPSAAQWEYGARAGARSAYWWGGRIEPGQANFSGAVTSAGTGPVYAYRPNRFGLFNVLGNAAEWVEDCWHPRISPRPNDLSAQIKGSCDKRMVKGGSWADKANALRLAARGAFTPAKASPTIGFRVVRELTKDDNLTN